MQATPSSSRGWARRLGVVLGVLLLLGIAGEVWLRLHPSGRGASEVMEEIRGQWDRIDTTYAPDAELGALLAPSRHDTFETPDFTYTRKTDHAGFPNPEPWPSRVDVAVLGDSLLIGTGVGMDGQFTTLLERRLDGQEVLNLGLPGSGTEQQYRIYRRYAAPLRPELVIAVLWPTWDIDNSLHFEHWLQEDSDLGYTEYRTTYNMTHRSTEQAEPAGLERTWDSVKSRLAESYLVRAAYESVKSLLGTDRMVSQATFPDGHTILLSANEQMRLARGIDRPNAPDIREIFFRPLERLGTEVEAQGGRFVVLLLPGKEEIYGADTFPAVLRTVQEVKSELESRQFQMLDLYPAFRERGQESPPFYRADMHLNQLGNQIVADAIEQWIADEDIFTGQSPATDLAGSGAE